MIVAAKTDLFQLRAGGRLFPPSRAESRPAGNLAPSSGRQFSHRAGARRQGGSTNEPALVAAAAMDHAPRAAPAVARLDGREQALIAARAEAHGASFHANRSTAPAVTCTYSVEPLPSRHTDSLRSAANRSRPGCRPTCPFSQSLQGCCGFLTATYAWPAFRSEMTASGPSMFARCGRRSARYTDPRLLDVRGALDTLPALPLDARPAVEAVKGTGTGPGAVAPTVAPTHDNSRQAGSFSGKAYTADDSGERSGGIAASGSGGKEKTR
jgi:hypothetical protein